MDQRPRNLKAMLSEAKDTSELMVDLGYAALFFADPAMAEEVVELEERLTSLIHEMRAVCVHAEEVSHRVRVREDSAMAHRHLAELELPTEMGMRVVALRRGKEWTIDPDGDEILLPNDVLITRGPRGGITELRELAGAPEWRPGMLEEDTAITDLDRAVDVLVEMKNISEVAVGLAYSAVLFKDQGLAAEVSVRARAGRRGRGGYSQSFLLNMT
jgi:uncharacterized protein with PhoU and TrkA domain